MGKVHLRHRELGGLVFGPDVDSAIKFGPRGGMPEGEAWVDEDDPLLPSLLETEPVEVVAPGPARIYVCPECEKEVKTRPALKAHMKSHGSTATKAQEAAEDEESAEV